MMDSFQSVTCLWSLQKWKQPETQRRCNIEANYYIMKIGIISDTHDNLEGTRKAADAFRVLGISKIIHAGDFCSSFTVEEFNGFDLHAVFGNNDGDHFHILNKIKEIGGTHHNEFLEFEESGIRIAAYHGTVPAITDALIKCGTYRVVISGHTHEAVVKSHGETLHINPGAAHGFGKQGTAAVLDLKDVSARIIQL
jgi:uncharacterized protein